MAKDPASGEHPAIDAWAAIPRGLEPTTGVRTEVRRTGERFSVAIVRELRSGETALAGGDVWSRGDLTEADAAHVREALHEREAELLLLCEAAVALPAGHIDAVVDARLARSAQDRAAALTQAGQRKADAARRARESRAIHVYFVKPQKNPILEMRRGTAKPFLTLQLGSEWERHRLWDWLKWQDARYAEFEARVAEVGEEEVRRELLYEMLATEQAVKKRKLGAGGRRPLIFWRGDL